MSAVIGFWPMRNPASKARLRCSANCSGVFSRMAIRSSAAGSMQGIDTVFGAFAKQPVEVGARIFPEPFKGQHVGAVADFLHRRAAKIVAQLRDVR